MAIYLERDLVNVISRHLKKLSFKPIRYFTQLSKTVEAILLTSTISS